MKVVQVVEVNMADANCPTTQLFKSVNPHGQFATPLPRLGGGLKTAGEGFPGVGSCDIHLGVGYLALS